MHNSRANRTGRVNRTGRAGRWAGLRLEPLEVRELLASDVVTKIDEFTVEQESDWVTLDVLANDFVSPEYGGAFEISAASDGSQGGFVRVSGGGKSLEYRPSVGVSGEESLSYIVDGLFFGSVTVSIASPLASDVYHILQASGETELTVLSNDPFFANYQGDRTISDVSATASGATVRVSDDGRTVFYTAPDDYYGYDSFRYLVDGNFEGRVSVQVHRPVQDDYGFEVERNSNDNVLRPLDNDIDHWWWLEDPSGPSPFELAVNEITSVSVPENGGTVTIAADGRTVIYTPAADYVGGDIFYYIADGKYQARVYVNVTRPVRDDRIDVLQLSQANVLNVRANDFLSDAYTGNRVITDVSPSSNGVVSISSNGRHLIYTPTGDFTGYDTFEYTIDSDLTAIVSVNVDPLARGDYYEYGANPSVHEYRISPLQNDQFALVGYSGPKQITSVTQPENGTVELLGNNVVLFTPAAGQAGYAWFEYTVDDRFTAHAAISVLDYLSSDSVVVKQNSSDNIMNVLTNDNFDTDYRPIGPYQGPRRISAVGETASGGTVTVGADARSVRYTPPENYTGTDSFQYTVDGVQSATVYVNVTSYARDDRYRVDPNSASKSLSVLLNDRSDKRESKSIDRVDLTDATGVATVAADGQSIHYQPATGFVGTDSFHYYLTDGSRAEVTVEVGTDVGDLMPRFTDHADMGSFLIDDAVSRYSELFGREYYQYYYNRVDFSGGLDSATPQERSHSETNVQVAGVDEGDIIEVDSDYLYVLTEDSLLIASAWPAEEIHTASRTFVEGTPLVEYLAGDRLTVIANTSVWVQDDGTIDSQTGGSQTGTGGDVFTYDSSRIAGDVIVDGFWPYPQGTYESSVTVTVYDVSDRAAPTVVETTKFDGVYKDSRAINGFVYVVLQDQFVLPEPEAICGEEDPNTKTTQCFYETEEQYLARVNENIGALIDASLPHFSSYGAGGEFIRGGLLAEASEIFRPVFDDHGDMLVVTSISMNDDEVGPVATAAIPMSSTTQIYGSLENLYVFGTDSYSDYDPATNVLKFSWDGETGGLDFVATGLVPGQLHGGNSFGGGYVGDIYIPYANSGTGSGQFSIDEQDGYLRIATTTQGLETGDWSWRSSSDIYVLADDGGVISAVGSLQNMTPDQTIKSVRFMGDRAFVVTFDTSDPLLAIDLADPTRPELKGQLLVPGFSSYLQPISENLVIGMGKNTPDGFSGPAQLSLFDISDLSHPVRVDQYTWDHWSRSEAALDHHAFGYFADHSVVALPLGSSRWVWSDTDDDGFLDEYVQHRTDDLYVFRYDTNGTITELGNVSHDWSVRRSVFIGDRLYSISTDDVIVSDINDPSNQIGQLVFGSRMFEPVVPDPENPIIFRAAATPTPLDDTAVTRILDASRAHLANELQTGVGQVSVVAVEGEVFNKVCQTQSQGDACATSITAGYEMVLDVAGTRYLYTATSENDVLMREAQFDFAVARGAVQNPILAYDVNGDGKVSPIDALLTINELGNKTKTLRSVDRDYEHVLFADTNGDGVVSPVDALSVIDALGKSAESVSLDNRPMTSQAAYYRAEHPVSTDSPIAQPAALGLAADAALSEQEPPLAARNFARSGSDVFSSVHRRDTGDTLRNDDLPPRIVDALLGDWEA